MSKPDSKDDKERREEVQELLDRCRAMEKELAEIKERVGKIQKAVEDALGRRPRGAALCGYPFEPLGAWARVEWPLGYQWHEPAGTGVEFLQRSAWS